MIIWWQSLGARGFVKATMVGHRFHRWVINHVSGILLLLSSLREFIFVYFTSFPTVRLNAKSSSDLHITIYIVYGYDAYLYHTYLYLYSCSLAGELTWQRRAWKTNKTDHTDGINHSHLYNIIYTDECLNIEQIYKRSISQPE